MSNIHVPHLNTFFFPVPDGQWIRLAEDRHRTFFAIQDREVTDIHIWVGANPSANTDEWFSIGGTDQIDIMYLPKGVYGPIYIAESGGGAGEVSILSSITEVAETITP